MKNFFRQFILLLGCALLGILMLSSHPARADTREAVLKRAALNNAHKEMFALGDFSKLDKEMNKVQREYEKGQWTDEELWELFGRPLASTDSAFEELYNKWVAAYPKSYAAHQGRAIYFFNRAWEEFHKAREISKAATIDQIPQEQAEKMRHFAELSIKDNTAALNLTKKPLLGYNELILMYAFIDDQATSRKMLDQANEIAPRNTIARSRYIEVLNLSDASADDMQKFMESTRKAGLDPKNSSGITNIFHARLLKEARYEELDKEMNQLQQDYESGRIDDVALEKYFSIFDNTDPSLEDKYGEWATMYPRSYAALQARCRYLIGMGLQARGNKYIKDTSSPELEGMQLYLKRAFEDGKTAMSLTAKPLLTYKSILRISQIKGMPETSKRMLDMANAIDPKNFVVRHLYMDSLEGRWGGSLAEMEKFLAEAKAAGVSDYWLMEFEAMIKGEKFWLAKNAGDKYADIGQWETGF